jgi:hypothetical protein
MSAFVVLLAIQAAQAPTSGSLVYEGRGAPEARVPRLEAAVTIDGQLDEPVWQEAARLVGFHQYEPVDGRPAEERTEVLVWYSPEAIHFGIRAFDRNASAIRASSAERDAIDGEDHVLVYLDTFDDRRRAFFFAANALGAQQDGVRTEGSMSAGRIFGGNIDKNPDFFFESRGQVTEDGYVIEMRIPFASLRYPPVAAQRWGINIERKVQRTGHTYTWTDARRASASFLSQSGTLIGLQDLRRGVVMEAQPFATLSLPGERNAVTGGFHRLDADPQIGANVRVGFPSLSLDATINPDFSQVETDEGQVTVNERFALFFTEKRPFFLEGIELFATPNQLVYSRRVVDPLVGTKLTGKFGSLNIAHLTAVDEDVDTAGREAVFNVTRLRRDLGSSSVAGLVFTDRSLLDGADYNRVLASDVRLVFGEMYFAEMQAGWSWTQSGAATTDAPIWRAVLDRTGRSWGFNYSLNGIGDGFDSQAGFVPRSGIVEGHAFNRFSLYGRDGAMLERVMLFFGPTRFWRHDGFTGDGAIEGSESATLSARFRGGWETSLILGRAFVDLDPAVYNGLESPSGGTYVPYRPLGEVSGGRIELSGRTPTFRAFDASFNASSEKTAIFPEGSEGIEKGITAGLNVRPAESVRVTFNMTLRRLTRSRDGSEFARTIIPRVRAELQPTRALLFRAVAEYRMERRAALEDARTGAPLRLRGEPVRAERLGSLRADLLASFRPTPGTIAFIGYGSSLEGTDDRFDPGALERTRDGFFIKIAYQLRR